MQPEVPVLQPHAPRVPVPSVVHHEEHHAYLHPIQVLPHLDRGLAGLGVGPHALALVSLPLDKNEKMTRPILASTLSIFC